LIRVNVDSTPAFALHQHYRALLQTRRLQSFSFALPWFWPY